MFAGAIPSIGSTMRVAAGQARSGFNLWAMRNPKLGFGALAAGAVGLAALAPGQSLSGGAVGGGIGAGVGLAGVAGMNYVGRGFGGSQTLLSGGRIGAKRLGLIGAGAGALIGATMNSNRGYNQFRGF